MMDTSPLNPQSIAALVDILNRAPMTAAERLWLRQWLQAISAMANEKTEAQEESNREPT